MQSHLNGLLEFCKKNLAIVNEIKTKCMGFGKIKKVTVKFNGKIIEQVDRYKCLGNILSHINRCNADPFKHNAEYLCDRARKALYAMSHRTRNISHVSPQLKFHMFNTLILPILTYGSDVWAVNKTSLKVIDKIFLIAPGIKRIGVFCRSYGTGTSTWVEVRCRNPACVYFLRTSMCIPIGIPICV